jgi:hypothetical protein
MLVGLYSKSKRREDDVLSCLGFLMLHSGSASLSGFHLGCRRRDPRCPPFNLQSSARCLQPATPLRHWLHPWRQKAGAAAPAAAAAAAASLRTMLSCPPAIDDPEDDPQQRADDEGEEEGTQCSVRAMTSAPVTEPPQQCGGHKGLFGPSAPPSGPLPATEGC